MRCNVVLNLIQRPTPPPPAPPALFSYYIKHDNVSWIRRVPRLSKWTTGNSFCVCDYPDKHFSVTLKAPMGRKLQDNLETLSARDKGGVEISAENQTLTTTRVHTNMHYFLSQLNCFPCSFQSKWNTNMIECFPLVKNTKQISFMDIREVQFASWIHGITFRMVFRTKHVSLSNEVKMMF